MNVSQKFPWVVPCVIFAILLVWGSGLHSLWGDEAETALYARSILKSGLPMGWDGKNIMGLTDAVALDGRLINYSNPWPQYYLAAFSFALFGQSALAARLPFVLLGITTIPLLYYFAQALTRKKEIAQMSVWIAAFSVPYILFAYQARYYSIVIFSGLLFSWGSLFLWKKTWRVRAWVIAAGTLFCYSHYISFTLFYGAFFLGYIAIGRMKKDPHIASWAIEYLICGMGIALLFAPWFFILAPYRYRGAPLTLSSVGEFGQLLALQLSWAFGPYHRNNALPIGLAVLLVIFIFWERKKIDVSPIMLVVLVPILYLIATAFLTVAIIADNPFTAIRYNVIVFPFFFIVAGSVLWWIMEKNKVVGILASIVLIGTNLLTLEKPRIYMAEYVWELTHPYTSAVDVVASYLNVHARDGDTVFLNMDRDHEPLLFQLQKQLLFVNRISPNNPRLFPKNRAILPRYLYLYTKEPDWVILMSDYHTNDTFFTFDRRDVFPTVNLADHYEKIVFPVYFADRTRPELEVHSFGAISPRYQEQVFLYRRITEQ